MAHHRLTKNVHEDMIYVEGFNNFASDSLPLDLYELKAIEDANREQNAQFKPSEKIRFAQNTHGTSDQRARLADKYNFSLNKDFISEILDVDPLAIHPVQNDWQDELKCVPELKNHLDILPRCPGIFPTESIAQFNKKRLLPFFTRLPQYSQINESCIGAYFPPGSDKNLLRIALKNQAKYMMSTSTITSIMQHLYYSISNHKSPHFNGLTVSYD